MTSRPLPSTSTLAALSSPLSPHDSTAEREGCGCSEMSAAAAGRAARRSLDAKRAGRRSLGDASLLSIRRGKQEEPSGFDRFEKPSEESLREAAQCMLVGESGKEIAFGDLIHERGQAVVVFLRHLWCSLCPQYIVALNAATHSLASLSSPLGSAAAIPPLYILLISSGSPSLISTYRSRLNCPFPLYVDPKGRKLYKALGMTRKTLDGGSEEEKGSYITRGRVANVVVSTVNGLSLRGNPGSQSQLGGEFVFASEGDDEGIRCLFSSRMSTTRNHSEVCDLFTAAGVKLSPEDEESVFRTPASNP